VKQTIKRAAIFAVGVIVVVMVVKRIAAINRYVGL
jgi:hypothetical protein